MANRKESCSFSPCSRIAAYGTGWSGMQDSTQCSNAGRAGVSSHHSRPRPGRRRRSYKLETPWSSTPAAPKPAPRISRLFLFSIFIALSLLCSPAAGAKAYGDRQRSANDRIVERGELLVDRSPHPVPQRMRLERRQNEEASSSTAELPASILPSSNSPASGSATDAVSDAPAATPTIIISADPSSAANLPQPFDTSLGNNFTSSACPNFIRSFRDNSTFLSCLPLSLLLQVRRTLSNQPRVRLTKPCSRHPAPSFKLPNPSFASHKP